MPDSKNPSFIAIIPARYASSRFPGKPLAKIGGREMILRVCDRVSIACASLAVATDDDRIARCVEHAGYRAVLTSKDHPSGTDRVREAFEKLGSPADVVINVQGDEPFIAPSQIEALIDIFRHKPEAELATLARPFDKKFGFEALFDPNLVKVTFSDTRRALYFSRSIIPYVRGAEWKQWLDNTEFHTHVGIYGYRAETLRRITSMPRSSLEIAESLEQLRWLQAGLDIHIGITTEPTVGIDTPADLAAAEKILAASQENN